MVRKMLFIVAVLSITLLAAAPALSKGPTNVAIAVQPVKAATADVIAIPHMLSYQGKLLDSMGNPVNETCLVQFRLYIDSVSGGAFWSETQAVPVNAGLFSVLLGSSSRIDSFPQAGICYLGMKVESDPEMTPRLRIASAAYAFLATKADTANYALAAALARPIAPPVVSSEITDTAVIMAKLARAGAITGQVIKWNGGAWAPGNDSVGGGTGDNAWVHGGDSVLYTIRRLGIARGGADDTLFGNQAFTHVNLGSGSTTGSLGQNYQYCTVGGGFRNSAGWYNSTVAGGDSNAAGPAAAIGGGEANSATGNAATIAGGYSNSAEAPYATVGGGDDNNAFDWCATVGGGNHNTAVSNATVSGGDSNLANGDMSTVGGGKRNAASGTGAAVVGGYGDTASGAQSFVGGGEKNRATLQYAVAAGGFQNTAGGYVTTISGGWQNAAGGDYAAVGGGNGNSADGSYSGIMAGDHNAATGHASFVGGGDQNVAGGPEAAVLGGTLNRTYGDQAAVCGGLADTVVGNYGFAAGNHSRVLPAHTNSAAFTGSATTASNQIRAQAFSTGSCTFTSDYPLDPDGKLLNQYAMGSSELVMFYRGVATIGGDGRVQVQLPDYFDAYTRNPMVQLTGVGTSDVYVSEEVSGNHFVIGGKPCAKVFWTVTGERKDVQAEITRILTPVEQPKVGPLRDVMVDDDALVGTMQVLEEMGKAGEFHFRTTAARLRYEDMLKRLGANGLERQ